MDGWMGSPTHPSIHPEWQKPSPPITHLPLTPTHSGAPAAVAHRPGTHAWPPVTTEAVEAGRVTGAEHATSVSRNANTVTHGRCRPPRRHPRRHRRCRAAVRALELRSQRCYALLLSPAATPPSRADAQARRHRHRVEPPSPPPGSGRSACAAPVHCHSRWGSHVLVSPRRVSPTGPPHRAVPTRAVAATAPAISFVHARRKSMTTLVCSCS